MPSSVMCSAPQSVLCQKGSVQRSFLYTLACVLDDKHILQCAEEVVHRKQDMKLWAHGASSISDHESVYTQRQSYLMIQLFA